MREPSLVRMASPIRHGNEYGGFSHWVGPVAAAAAAAAASSSSSCSLPDAAPLPAAASDSVGVDDERPVEPTRWRCFSVLRFWLVWMFLIF